MIPNVLSIAGSDPSGGAGLQADLRTFAAFGVYGCAVPVALTVQNTLGALDVFHVPPDLVRRQLEVLLDDVTVDAVKIGMLGDAETVFVVADVLRQRHIPLVVLDPVMRASAGGTLLTDRGTHAVREHLLPLANVLTPNATEASALLDAPLPLTRADADALALRLAHLTGMNVVLTGGHVDRGEACVDVLTNGDWVQHFSTPRHSVDTTHGTGCTYASALTSLLSLRFSLPSACAAAQAFVGASIAAGGGLRVGRGRGPVWQLGDHCLTSARNHR